MQLLAKNELVSTHIPLHVHPARRWYRLPLQILGMGTAFFKSLYHLHRTKPAKLISTGGLVAIPVCLAAWVLRIPIELYELNAVPGKAIKFLAPISTSIFVCFKQAKTDFPAAKCTLFDYPLRYAPSISNEMAGYSGLAYKDKVLNQLNFKSERKTLFILGGSQGSHFINQTIERTLQEHPELTAQIQIIHQTGGSDSMDYRARYAQLGIPAHVFAFDNNLARYYAIADLVTARAGAGTIFETLYFKTPCILIPLETKATDHQVDNAAAIVAEYPNQFCMIRQKEIEQDNQKFIELIYKKMNLYPSILRDERIKSVHE